MAEGLEFTVEDGIARITLDRQARMNAFTFEMIDAWAEALVACRTDEAVRVVVVTGRGKAFCSGGDIVELGNRLEQTPQQRKNELWRRVQRIPLALEDLDKPVIAALNGTATGAGLDLALACDMRFAARSARFAETYMQIGLVPGAGGAHFLPRLVGQAKAMELFLTGRFVDAEEALQIGMVNAVFDDETFAEQVDDIAARIARRPPETTKMLKRLIQQSPRNDLRVNLDLVSSHYAIITASEGHREAVRKFLDKQGR
jgi:2-(1,2-epoxy-1,2-dihydrophenyl)acetyl-CoA isomerase